MDDFTRLARLAESPDAVCATTGFTGVDVYHLRSLSAYLKIGPLGRITDLAREARVLRFLHQRALVPAVIDYASSGTHEALLISAIDGDPLSTQLAAPRAGVRSNTELVALAAKALRDLHSLETADADMHQGLAKRFRRARRNIELGLLSESDEEFAAGHAGSSPNDVYHQLFASRPAAEDLVFTHGDPSAPNIIFRDQAFGGFIDLDGAGLADRYVDIAIFLRSAVHNSPVAFDIQSVFCNAYGIDEIDVEKMRFYTLMDDLF